MTSQVSPVTFPVNWAKVVDFTRNSIFGKQMAKKKFKMLFQHFIIVYFRIGSKFIFEVRFLLNMFFRVFVSLLK